MLKLGGIINVIISIGHIIGMFWADQMFESTGVGKEMAELAQIHYSLPYLLTVFAAVVFLVFGLYGIYAKSENWTMPYLKIGIFVIAGTYLFRGLGEMGYSFYSGIGSGNETMQSVVSIIIGLLYLIGGVRLFRFKSI